MQIMKLFFTMSLGCRNNDISNEISLRCFGLENFGLLFLCAPRAASAPHDTSGLVKKKVVFYGKEPPSRESTTTEFVFNYQLLAVIY